MNCKVCKNTSVKNNKVSFFRFPKESGRCKDWAERCNLLHLFEKYDTFRFYKSFRICSDHFDPNYIVFDGRKKRLLPTAVPHDLANVVNIKERKETKNVSHDQVFKFQLVKNLCRLCAEENKNLTDIFGAKGKMLNFENKLKYFPVAVKKCDILPLKVCNQCISKVNQFCDFITNCIKAETKLKIMLDVEDCNEVSVKTSENKSQRGNYKSEMKKVIVNETPIKNLKPDIATPTELSCNVYNKVIKDNLLRNCSNENNNNSVNVDKDYTKHEIDVITTECFKTQNYTNDVKVDFSKNVRSNHEYSTIYLREHVSSRNNKIQTEPEDQSYTSDTKFPCTVCVKSFSNVDVLNSHSKTHLQPNNDGKVVGKTQSKSFLNRQSPNIYTISTIGEPPIKCQTRNQKFQGVAFKQPFADNMGKMCSSNLFNLRSSREYEESNCKSDAKSFRILESKHYKQNFLEIKSLNETPNFVKTNCKYQNVKNKRKCWFCDKCFKSVDICSAHEKIHTGETPYQCKECGKKFRSRPSLRQHRSVHSDKRLFTCQDCGKSFKRKDTLSNHLRIHTGERPFICKVCGFAFKQRGDCIKHEKNHEKDFETGIRDLGKQKTEVCKSNEANNIVKKAVKNDSQAMDEALWNEVNPLQTPVTSISTKKIEEIVGERILTFEEFLPTEKVQIIEEN